MKKVFSQTSAIIKGPVLSRQEEDKLRPVENDEIFDHLFIDTNRKVYMSQKAGNTLNCIKHTIAKN
jgi:hypothetical protein